jgi:rod shape-determining protein MreC
MARSERSARRGGVPLLVALLLCVAVSLLHRHSEAAHRPDPVTGLVRDAGLVSAQEITLNIERWWHTHVASAFNGPHLAAQNTALQAQVSALTLQNQRLLKAQAENVRLRQLLHFQSKSDRAPLAGEVIALKPSPLLDTLIVDRGLRDGVGRRTVVLGPNGTLVGQVIDVDLSHGSSQVLLLTDANSSVGAEAVRPGRPGGAVGICVGDRAGHLTLTDLPREADILPGDFVRTSGLGGAGGVYPKGIPIGVVQSVAFDKGRSLKAALIRPAVDFDHLEDVFLLTQPSPPAADDSTDTSDISVPSGATDAPAPPGAASP